MAGKQTLMVVAKTEDVDYFKALQKEYRDQGKTAMYLFAEFVECHKEKYSME